ncbi:2-succinyl-5-enolpyruvyl-6-hydroxy-3-cyclohexene-1-carboxylic-acid synthase [Virgibacillus necropolis]|uniref:2-succinyl-5-enolpyruvyl-6-hydroxy-3-cyclohexene-1-carboxylate synthase n=1 Tax=Virgibacillus necropolis TaxID=163877 RepID=A0A221MBC6_9BACI|nr:2-succinyl-5-enolpyruvyl-6-hydroxy-3-cyclohexene-1-carboxylic-acid synthase [Virgibacillus necropolis]ASN04910.1 2-succinyl-5-enolpyruvyl-6-hydroxy-3-cyclohexene-1-carboxylic-acid synthase [Virgibacillus necropolis]
MSHTEDLTRYTANFVDELVRSGLTEVVISPGSRSTPLAMTIVEHPGMKQWVIIDERSAAFFALGMAKQLNRPVAIVCTSGTAAANYFPAIVEAYYSRVPLVVLTADRPHELRDVGAPQSIDQLKMYGDYVKWFHEMGLPDADPKMLNYARSKASRAIHVANEGNAGPVHVNIPFREPLIPDFTLENVWGNKDSSMHFPTIDGKKRVDHTQLSYLLEKFANKKRGLIVCGPQTNRDFAESVSELASKWQIPVLADPLSQVRAGQHHKDLVIEGYDAFLRNETVRKKMKPDFIIRFGAMPVSKPYLFYVKDHKDVEQYIVEEHSGYREPAGNRTEFIFSDSQGLCEDLLAMDKEMLFDKEWLEDWQRMNQTAKKYLINPTHTETVTEGEAVKCLMEVIPDESFLYVGNSMAVRDLDTFFMTTPKQLDVLANRGANGIDGMVSSGLGAAANGQPTTLLLGDLSFFHDMNGLLAAKHYKINLTIVLINNDGGGIFSFLPQQQQKDQFELLFGTAHGIDFSHAIEMYGGKHQIVTSEKDLEDVLFASYKHEGLSVVEVKTDRTSNMEWHRVQWKQIETELSNGE